MIEMVKSKTTEFCKEYPKDFANEAFRLMFAGKVVTAFNTLVKEHPDKVVMVNEFFGTYFTYAEAKASYLDWLNKGIKDIAKTEMRWKGTQLFKYFSYLGSDGQPHQFLNKEVQDLYVILGKRYNFSSERSFKQAVFTSLIEADTACLSDFIVTHVDILKDCIPT